MKRTKLAPTVVEIPRDIYNSMMSYASRNWVLFGSVKWGMDNIDSDIDFLVLEDEWCKTKSRWFKNEKRMQLISYDESIFNSIKVIPNDHTDHDRVLNIVTVIDKVEYDATIKAIEHMEYFINSPLVEKKTFRVRLFEMLKDEFRSQHKPDNYVPSEELFDLDAPHHNNLTGTTTNSMDTTIYWGGESMRDSITENNDIPF